MRRQKTDDCPVCGLSLECYDGFADEFEIDDTKEYMSLIGVYNGQ
jgi:hypothetical protein